MRSRLAAIGLAVVVAGGTITFGSLAGTTQAGASESIAAAILRNLAGGAISSIGSRSIGLILAQFGGNGSQLNGEIAAIRGELARLNSAVVRLEAEVEQLRGLIQQSDCNNAARNLTDTTSAIQTASRALADLASVAPSNQADRTGQANHFRSTMQPLLTQQVSFRNRVLGLGDDPGVLLACSRAYQLRLGPLFAGSRLRSEVQTLADFYRDLQVELLLLRVNYFNGQPNPPTVTINGEIADVTAWTNQIQGRVKDALPADMILDSRSGLFWYNRIRGLFDRATIDREIAQGKFPLTGLYPGYLLNIPSYEQLVPFFQAADPNPLATLRTKFGLEVTNGSNNPTNSNASMGCLWTTNRANVHGGRHQMLTVNVNTGQTLHLDTANGSLSCFLFVNTQAPAGWQQRYLY